MPKQTDGRDAGLSGEIIYDQMVDQTIDHDGEQRTLFKRLIEP